MASHFPLLLRNRYLAEVKADLRRHPPAPASWFTDKDISGLPEPVQNYFSYCGYLDNRKMSNAELLWGEARLKMAPDRPWVKIRCYQYNSVTEPTRIVYMSSRLLGLLPFEGRDTYQNGHGNMLIKCLKIIPVTNAKGPAMDTSALVTVLAETLLVPSYALQPYVRWEAMDKLTAKAILHWQGITVSGIFRFNARGEMLCFETQDRYFTEKDGSFTKLKWSALMSNYRKIDGICLPGVMQAVWHLGTGDYTYFQGKISRVRYNISHIA